MRIIYFSEIAKINFKNCFIKTILEPRDRHDRFYDTRDKFHSILDTMKNILFFFKAFGDAGSVIFSVPMVADGHSCMHTRNNTIY